jgi:hypothetical protein
MSLRNVGSHGLHGAIPQKMTTFSTVLSSSLVTFHQSIRTCNTHKGRIAQSGGECGNVEIGTVTANRVSILTK